MLPNQYNMDYLQMLRMTGMVNHHILSVPMAKSAKVSVLLFPRNLQIHTLNVQLAGDAWYFGKLYKKPFIGDANRPVEIEDIPRANKLMYATAILGAVMVVGIAVAGTV